MKEFDTQAINAAREFFFNLEGSSRVETTVGEHSFDYFVLPRELNPDLPLFAIRMTHTDEETGEISGIFGVSDEVPDKFRDYWAFHEYYEFMELGINTEGRCAQAENKTYSLVPEEDRYTFTNLRLEFFENLMRFMQEQIDSGSQDFAVDDLREIDESAFFLTCHLT